MLQILQVGILSDLCHPLLGFLVGLDVLCQALRLFDSGTGDTAPASPPSATACLFLFFFRCLLRRLRSMERPTSLTRRSCLCLTLDDSRAVLTAVPLAAALRCGGGSVVCGTFRALVGRAGGAGAQSRSARTRCCWFGLENLVKVCQWVFLVLFGLVWSRLLA